jgi:hypothetical protein
MSDACARCATPLEAGDLRCAVCALPAPLPPAVAADEAVAAQILRCSECGAAMAFVAEVGAPRCAFCGAITAVERPLDPVEAPRRRLPFVVDRAAAQQALRGWLGRRGRFAPDDLADAAIVEQLAPLAWSCWLVSARAEVAWTADSDAGAERSAWAPHAGEVELRFDNLAIPGTRGLSRDEAHALVRHYDLGTAVDVAAADPRVPDAVIEQFAVQRSAARAHLQRVLTDQAERRVAADHVPGRQVRNVNVAVLVRHLTTERLALPAWVLSYRYDDRPYRAIIHGQDAAVVVGKAPVDARKVAIAVALGLAAVGALVALIYLLAHR